MYQLLKKDFEIPIKLKKEQILKYSQVSLYECLEFSYEMKSEDFKMDKWLFDFLKQRIEIKYEELIFIDLQKLVDTIFTTRFRDFFGENKKKSSYPFEAYIMFLSEKFSLDPLTLMKTYTPEQIKYLVDGVVYNINEQSKEGQKRNAINSKMKEMQKDSSAEDDLAMIKRMEEQKNLKSKK